MRAAVGSVALLALSLVGACASLPAKGTLDYIYKRPEKADGMIVTATVYLYDLYGEPNRYLLCEQPCSKERAAKSASILISRVRGAYAGADGTRPVEVKVRFNGYCFRPEGVCLMLDGQPFIFEEVE